MEKNSENKTLQERINNFEEIFGKSESYTLQEVLQHPIKYSQGFIRVGKELIYDAVIIATPKNNSQKFSQDIINLLYLSGGTVTANLISTGPHELLHALGACISGADIHEIAITPAAGGDLYHQILPWIKSKPLGNAAGHVVVVPDSLLADAITILAPYAILTPLAAIAIQEGKKTNNCFYAGFGIGLLLPHLAGIGGDFLTLGINIVKNTYETITKEPLRKEHPKIKDELTETITVGTALIASFLIGNRIMGYTYSLSRGLANSIQNYFKK